MNYLKTFLIITTPNWTTLNISSATLWIILLYHRRFKPSFVIVGCRGWWNPRWCLGASTFDRQFSCLDLVDWFVSETAILPYFVPQGSVLWPLLFFLYAWIYNSISYVNCTLGKDQSCYAKNFVTCCCMILMKTFICAPTCP